MRDEADLSLLFPPTDTCYICGMAHSSSADNCPRCGATGGDIRLLLRAGAKAYSHAREAALAYRFAEAREHLRVAASLGLGQCAACWELSRLVEKSDANVGANEDADYALAHHLAKEGRHDAVRAIALPPTPIATELRRLSQQAATQTRQQYGGAIVRYALWGVFCVFLAIIAGC
ncbi:MAG: hypothetical protein H7Y38_01705 [Armatimonadetes bacterium]|nr:hypothetical protein [Armatimonadota bacterium]